MPFGFAIVLCSTAIPLLLPDIPIDSWSLQFSLKGCFTTWIKTAIWYNI